MQQACQVFGIIPNGSEEQITAKIKTRLENVARLQIPLKDFESIFQKLQDYANKTEFTNFINSLDTRGPEANNKPYFNYVLEGATLDHKTATMTYQSFKRIMAFIQILIEVTQKISNPELSRGFKPQNELIQLCKHLSTLSDISCPVYFLTQNSTQTEQSYGRFIGPEILPQIEVLCENYFYVYSFKLYIYTHCSQQIFTTADILSMIPNIPQITQELISFNSISQCFCPKLLYNEIIAPNTKLLERPYDLPKIAQTVINDFKAFSPDKDGHDEFFKDIILHYLLMSSFNNISQFLKKFYQAYDQTPQFDLGRYAFGNFLKKNRDDKAIQAFLNFQGVNDGDTKKLSIAQFNSKNWPKLTDLGIGYQDAYIVITFWDMFSTFLLKFIDCPECDLLRIMDTFLSPDSEPYKNFAEKIRTGFIEPINTAVIADFISVMEMFKAIDFVDPKALSSLDIMELSYFRTFSIATDTAIQYFRTNAAKLLTLPGSIDNVVLHTDVISGLELTDAIVVEEYEYVNKVLQGSLRWNISYKNHTCLLGSNGQPDVDFIKLSLIAAKLDITMIPTKSQAECQEQFDNSRHFVDFFHNSETLYQHLKNLHDLSFGIGDKAIEICKDGAPCSSDAQVFKQDNPLDLTEINKKIQSFEKISKIANEKFEQIFLSLDKENALNVFKHNLSRFTKEQFFTLYKLFNQIYNQRNTGGDHTFVSILHSTFISKLDPTPNTYKALFQTDTNFEVFTTSEITKDQITRFQNSIDAFCQILNKGLDQIKNNTIEMPQIRLAYRDNLIKYLQGGAVKALSLKNVHTKDDNSTSINQIHSAIIELLSIDISEADKRFPELPQPYQLLICSLDVTRSQVEMFLHSVHAENTTRDLTFVVVSPFYLSPDLYHYLMTDLQKFNETSSSKSRVIILYNEDELRKDSTSLIGTQIRSQRLRPPTELGQFGQFYNLGNPKAMNAYYIYEQFPRTGKTHTVLSKIFNNDFPKMIQSSSQPNHLYHRILIDESTTLTMLIELLHTIPRVDDKTVFIHFNVDGKCSPYFHLHIQNLAFFGSLNDGHSVPFIYKKNMIFIFEFGPRPSMNRDEFIQRVFPIAKYMNEIVVPQNKEQFFSFDEYHTLPVEITDPITGLPTSSLYVHKEANAKQFLYESAALTSLSLDPQSFLNADKYAKFVRYSDFINYYSRTVDKLKNSPQESYRWLMRIFKSTDQGGIFSQDILNQIPESFRNPLISQLSDVAKLLYTFKGPILSQITYENEESLGVNIRKLLLGVLIEACVTNCGLPYIPPMEEGTTTISESSKNDTLRLKRILKFIQTGHMLAINDPGNPNPDDQSYTLIMHSNSNEQQNGDREIESILHKFKYGNNITPEIIQSVRSALHVIDNAKWQTIQNSPIDLFNIFSEILNLQRHYHQITQVSMIVNIWRSLSFKSKQIVSTFWTKHFQKIQSNVKQFPGQTIKDIRDEYSDINIPGNPVEAEQFKWRKQFFYDTTRILADLPFSNKGEFSTKYQPTDNVTHFISTCEKYVQDQKSLMLKYTLTPQNIERFIHLVYRIYANVPIILMGETGSGKTFTLNFLAEIIGANVKLVKRVIDGGTTETILRGYMKSMLSELQHERYESIKHQLKQLGEKEPSPAVKAAIDYILQQPNLQLTSVDSICELGSKYFRTLSPQVLQSYDVQPNSQHQVDKLKGYILYKLSQIYKAIESQQKTYLFFFDEVNTAPCQWFLKELIIDRYFEGKNLPEYIHFACAVNPTREMPPGSIAKLDALEPVHNDSFEDDKANLIYKVREMPESFIPFLFPADPRRDFGSYSSTEAITANIDSSLDHKLYDTRLNSEFDVSILKKVVSEFSCKTYEFNKSSDPSYVFNPASNNKKELVRLGDEIHFSLTDQFSTSFDFEFFDALFKDQITSELVIDQLNYILSMINVFSCRVLYHVIYQDESFSSIRDPERCIRILRWAYKIGMSAELPKPYNEADVFDRLRKAFIIGLSVSFYIRLSNNKDKETGKTDREKYSEALSNYWKFILQEVINRLNSQKTTLQGLSAAIPNEIAEKRNNLNSAQDDDKRRAIQRDIDRLTEEGERNGHIMKSIDRALDIITNHFKAPEPEEFVEIIKNECDEYADIFVEDDECVSKNIALTENIWVSYICIMNNIPLWIIGKPGTSKSLAINIVINKLMNRSSLNNKIAICPHLVSQTFLCSQSSTTHAILEQLGKIVKKGRMFSKENYIINLQILEEIGHADQSPFRPLVCLHNIIDNGYQLENNVFVPVTLLGLSNYKMDSAKLNRGILLLRSELNEKEMETTAYDIFESTARAWGKELDPTQSAFESRIKSIGSSYQRLTQQLNDDHKAFVGLRDFYGLIQSITHPLLHNEGNQATYLTLIQRNFSGIPYFRFDRLKEYRESTYNIITELYKKINVNDADLDDFKDLVYTMNDYESETTTLTPKQLDSIPILTKNMSRVINNNLSQEQRSLRTPIVRQIMISTKNNAAYSYILQNPHITNSSAEFFFSQNLSKYPTNEWISDELRRLATIMYENKIAIFIGKHPCFDSLYDIFNLRYQRSGDHSSAMLSFGGDSYATQIEPAFKVIIILEDADYKSLPQPFLNRFEKFIMTFETELSPSMLEFCTTYEKVLKDTFHTRDLSTCFGCYSSELLKSCFSYLANDNSNITTSNIQEFVTLSVRPSAMIHASKFDSRIQDSGLINKALIENSALHSTLLHLVRGYDYLDDGQALCNIFYRKWKSNRGISAITMVPTYQGIEKLKDYDYNLVTVNSTELHDLHGQYIAKIDQIQSHDPLIIALIITHSNESTSQQIIQFEKILEGVKDASQYKFSTIHTLIVIPMDCDQHHLKINQSIEWPLLYLDSCFKDSIIKDKKNIPFDLNKLVFQQLGEIFPISNRNQNTDFDAIVEHAFETLLSSYSEKDSETIKKLRYDHNSTFFERSKKLIVEIFNQLLTSQQQDEIFVTNWSFNQITRLVTPPPSLLEYLSQNLLIIIANLIEIFIMISLSGLDTVENLSSAYFDDQPAILNLLNRHYNLNYTNIANETNMIQVYPIETRYTSNIKYIGQLPFYKLIWDYALNLQHHIANDEQDIEEFQTKLKSKIFQDGNLPLKPDDMEAAQTFYSELMNSHPGSQEFQLFIATYLNSIAPNFRIIKENLFNNWLRMVDDIIDIFYDVKQNNLAVKDIIYNLTQPFVVTFFKEFTIAHSLVPNLDAKDLVSRECLEHKTVDSPYIISETAYLILQIFVNLSTIIQSLELDSLQQLNDLFSTEFTVIMSILCTVKMYTAPDDNGEEEAEAEENEGEGSADEMPQFVANCAFSIYDISTYGVYSTIQQFFLLYGQNIKAKPENISFVSLTDEDCEAINDDSEDKAKNQLDFLMRFIDRNAQYLANVDINDIKYRISDFFFELMSDIYAGFTDENELYK